MLRTALTSWIDAVGLSVDATAWSRLESLVELWQRYGPALNLLGAYDPPSLVEHVREGLAARRVAELAVGADGEIAWIDVGSGGGLPGLVVAATTGWSVVLVEPRAKRAAFLELACAMIAQGVSRVSRARFGETTWDKDAAIEQILGSESTNLIVSARAVLAPDRWLALARSRLPPRAIVLVHVGSEVDEVAGEAPRWRVDAGRWALLGYEASRTPR